MLVFVSSEMHLNLHLPIVNWFAFASIPHRGDYERLLAPEVLRVLHKYESQVEITPQLREGEA